MKNVVSLMAIVMSVFALPCLAQNDPTAPLSWQAPAASVRTVKSVRLPQLQSIVCQDAMTPCYAILNGRTLAVGERIHGYTVSTITEDAVRLARGGRHWRLRVFADNVITE